VAGIPLDAVFCRASTVAWRRVADEVVLVPVCRSVEGLDSVFVLNEVAGRVWELLDGRRRMSDIRDAIVREFEVDPPEAGADLMEIVGELARLGVAAEVPS